MQTTRNDSRRETVVLRQTFGSTFGYKLPFTVGTAYLSFGLFGFVSGFFNMEKPKFVLPTARLRASYYANQMTMNSLRYANAAGGASVLYYIVGFFSNWLLEDYLEGVPHIGRNVVVGTLTGLLYKSTRGLRGAVVGGVVGGALIGGMNLATDYLREHDYTTFEMKFN